MTINYETKTIVMTKTESKEAGKFNSEKYLELTEITSKFPMYKIVIKSTPKKRDTFKGLNYDYMKSYIEKQNDEEALNEFYTLRGFVNEKRDKSIDAATYGEVKNWFLLKYPNLKDLNAEVDKLREKIKKEAKDKKNTNK